jgi:hypothetical protein
MTRSFQLVIALGAVALSAACSSHSGDSSKAAPATEPGVETRAGPGPTNETDASATCAAIAERFRQTLASASGACATDADCGCYNPVVAEAGCGGVTDQHTAVALGELQTEFLASGCDWPHQCGPWACEPRCDDGRCAH